MATPLPIRKRSTRFARYLTIVGVAFALVLGALVVDAAASTGLLTRTVALEGAAFHILAKYPPLKFVVPSPDPAGVKSLKAMASEQADIRRSPW